MSYPQVFIEEVKRYLVEQEGDDTEAIALLLEKAAAYVRAQNLLVDRGVLGLIDEFGGCYIELDHRKDWEIE